MIFSGASLASHARVDRARRLHSTFDSISQAAKHAPRAPVQRFVCRARSLRFDPKHEVCDGQIIAVGYDLHA
jgi:hypothetical protein